VCVDALLLCHEPRSRNNRRGIKSRLEDWKLKAIDSINIDELPQDQFHRIIDKLITNQEIKEILIRDIKKKPSKSEGVKMITI